LLLAGLAFSAVALAAPAGAAGLSSAYPPPVVGLQLSTSVVVPGQTIGVTGEGWAAGSTVTLTFFSDPVTLGTTVPNASGDFSSSVTIPANAALGTHTVQATGASLANPAVPLTLTASLTVVASTAAPAAAAPAPSHPLPLTGWDTRGPLLGGLALLIIGTGAVLLSRNRRHRSHA
jgi:LPXTG-motif cell wall-anchored protein